MWESMKRGEEYANEMIWRRTRIEWFMDVGADGGRHASTCNHDDDVVCETCVANSNNGFFCGKPSFWIVADWLVLVLQLHAVSSPRYHNSRPDSEKVCTADSSQWWSADLVHLMANITTLLSLLTWLSVDSRQTGAAVQRRRRKSAIESIYRCGILIIKSRGSPVYCIYRCVR